MQLVPAPLNGSSGGCALNVALVEAGGFAALLAVDAADASGNANLTSFLADMAALTARPLASYSRANAVLQQTMTRWAASTPTGPQPPPGMVRVEATNASGWSFAVSGTEIEGGDIAGTDVQFPWEAAAHKVHPPLALNVSAFFIDITPVTNAAFAAFLSTSGYVPTDTHNFLRDWLPAAAGAGPTVPPGWENKPVTWVDRLPNDWEWQRAAQGDDGRLFPWGDTFDASRMPAPQTGRVRPAPPDVGLYANATSPYGMLDALGLVWQWTNEFTDAHTRAGLVRGGGYYGSTGSMWYFPNEAGADGSVNLAHHNKLLLMAPSYDRHGTVGFRCAADAL